MFNPANNVGTTTVTYTVDLEGDDLNCSTGSDSATITITVNEPVAANAGEDITMTYCTTATDDVDLTTLFADGILTIGTFSAPYENGVFNPSTAGEGVYTITYTLDEAVDCVIGTDAATITLTVNSVADAPEAPSTQSFCLSENPTVGDLVVTGDNVVYYEDEDLSITADATDALVNDMVYYAVATSEDTPCGSAPTMITVTINDAIAPTLSVDGDQFCRQDNPTVQDLINNLNGDGIQVYTAVTGGTPLAPTALLENTVTYYASATDATLGCESTERLPVTALVEFCGIPELFSPNGDNVNDSFVIPSIREDYPNYNIEIYNRWGSLVFKGNAATPDWDGYSNQGSILGDKVLPAAVYFYILNYNDGQTTPVQGKVYLSR